MALTASPIAKFNLSETSILLLEGSIAELDLYAQMLCGFGARIIHRCLNQEEARDVLRGTDVDLILVGAKLPDGDGFEFVRGLRRLRTKINFTPVLMIAGHTPRSKVTLARDCGAHFVVRKPVSPGVLLERILWIAQESRPFIECEAYVGPERRFQCLGLPDGEGRRKDDLPLMVGEATTPNLVQDEVDQLLSPRKGPS